MTEGLDEAKIRIRARLRDDFEFYAGKALKIRTKEAQIVPLEFNPAQKFLNASIQRQLEKTGKVRCIILKARQQGLSTVVGAYLYHRVSQSQAKKAIVVTHKADSTTALFNMTKRYHENVPEVLKPSTSYSSRKELTFDKLDSSYMVATAGGDAIARGETITHAHISELAFWKESSARDNLNGLLQSIPDTEDTAVFIESTANGVTGPFYEMWRGAVTGENGYEPIFIPWFLDPNYREPAPEEFERTPEEEQLALKAQAAWDITLNDDQLFWRRRKIALNGKDQFKQEYPAEPDEAFLTTGRPVFDPEMLTTRREERRPIKRRMALELESWREHPMGELLMYYDIDPGETYYIGADVAMGVRNGDYSVACILDSSKRQVGVWRGHIHPDYFAEVLYHLGTYYNQAKIAVEKNNHGLLTVTHLYKVLHYPNVFTDVVEDKMTDIDTVNLGFATTAKTKPLIIDDLRGALREGEVELNDLTTITEMLTFVVKESGKLEADENCFDDTVMALAICNHIHEGAFTPIKVVDDFYVEPI